jgi:benzylsuccinate CoA-transferase BbsF subunit
MVAPINDAADLHRSPQLAARDFWIRVGDLEHPGPFAKLSRTPLTMSRPAPAVGADQQMLDGPQPSRAAAPSGGTVTDRLGEAFHGLKVADFSWIGVGPITARALADHGATVVHVESATRPDILRLAPPAKDGEAGIDRSQFFADYNSSKLGLALNLATPEGHDLALRLIDWADVVVESFTPGTMKKLGLDPEEILGRRPDLVWYSTCLLGQTGPYATFAGFGQQGSAIAGLHGITGWPDRPPAGTWGAYSDMITPHFGIAALAAAVLERRHSGLGQRIDISQVEAAMRFMEPLLLDYTTNGSVPTPIGLDSPFAAPHGVYPARGLERYVAIACETDAQWEAFRDLAGLSHLGEFDSLEARRAGRDRIDAAIAAWTTERDPFEAERLLVDAGVPAAVCQFPTDLYADPQVAHRGFFVTLDHPVMGPTPYDGLITRFSAKRTGLHKAAPALGENTVEVLTDFLGLSEEEVQAAAIAGALT